MERSDSADEWLTKILRDVDFWDRVAANYVKSRLLRIGINTRGYDCESNEESSQSTGARVLDS